MTQNWPYERWGCPEWQDPQKYPINADELEDWQWKWEFLRRNSELRHAYDPFVLKMSEGKFPKGSVLWDIMRRHGMHYIPDPTGSSIDIQNPFTMTGGSLLPSIDQLNSLSIDLNSIKIEEAIEVAKLIAVLEQSVLLQREGNDHSLAYAVFDYSKPINPQLMSVERQLLAKQVTLNPELSRLRNRREKWPRHLRVIDAKDQDATHEEIFEQFAIELTGGGDKAMDAHYRKFEEPKAIISQWVKQANAVMVKAALLL